MAAEYYINNKLLKDCVVTKSDRIKKMITDNNFFKFEDFKFNSTDSTEFAKANNYNENTWGCLKPTYYKYRNNDVPFINPDAVPLPYLVDFSDDLYKQFPTSNIDETKYQGTAIRYINSSVLEKDGSLDISYTSDGYLLVKKGTTEYLKAKASPYILLDIQAPGGQGGKGACVFDYYVLNHYYALGGGAGGSAGCFVSLSANLNDSGTLSIKNTTDHYVLTLPKADDDQLMIGKGTPGGNGSASVIYSDQTASGGTASNDKSFCIMNSSGNTTKKKENELKNLKHGNVYIIEALRGGNGANGASLKCKWADNEASRRAVGNTADNITTDISLTSVSQVTCALYQNVTSSGGEGEQTSDARIMCGGGGGGASLMAKGGSHSSDSNYKPGIGAGGFGGSGWASGNAGDTSGHNQSGSSGGPGALWIYYIPLHSWGDWTITAPTCITEGKRERVCTLCNKLTTESIPTIDHEYSTSYIDPTCTEYGYTARECIMCGKQEDIYNYIEPLGHVEGEWERYMNNYNTWVKYCTRCGEIVQGPTSSRPYNLDIVFNDYQPLIAPNRGGACGRTESGETTVEVWTNTTNIIEIIPLTFVSPYDPAKLVSIKLQLSSYTNCSAELISDSESSCYRLFITNVSDNATVTISGME